MAICLATGVGWSRMRACLGRSKDPRPRLNRPGAQQTVPMRRTRNLRKRRRVGEDLRASAGQRISQTAEPHIITNTHSDRCKGRLSQNSLRTGAVTLGFAIGLGFRNIDIEHVNFVIGGDGNAVRINQERSVGKAAIRIIRQQRQRPDQQMHAARLGHSAQRGKSLIVSLMLQHRALVAPCAADAIRHLGRQNEFGPLVRRIMCHLDGHADIGSRVIADIHLQERGFHLGRQQSVKFARTLQRKKIITTAHMGLAHENLWHSATTIRALDHLRLAVGLLQNIHFGKGHTLFIQQPLGRVAKATKGGGIDLDRFHGAGPFSNLALPMI
mmetsp:Transcript_18034/g.27583  ORF Transcript_18034/g.27583 Transcript_18034/m.27583 type:complete len:327 (+) Transcript_18034:4753-5733(+)